MPEFLVFRLAGPIASFGDDATVGERRTSWRRPGRSAVIGIIAAALGIRREEEEAQLALDTSLGLAVRLDGAPMPLRDFHTARAPSARKGARFATRRDELAARRLNTVVSERWYWTDVSALVALWDRGDADLQRLQAALERPRFAIYLGRKACPSGWPLAPAIIEAGDLASALKTYDAADHVRREAEPSLLHLPPAGGEAWADADPDEARETHVRRDRPLSRRSWTFQDRREARIPLVEEPAS